MKQVLRILCNASVPAWVSLLLAWNATAADGSALGLDGVAGYAAANDSPSLDLGTDGGSFTLEAFVYVPRPDLSGIKTIFYKSWAYALAINFKADGPDYVFFRVWASPGGLEGQNYFTMGASVDVTATWHHIAAVYDNRPGNDVDLRAIYLDGKQIVATESLGFDPGIYNSTLPFQVGGYVGVNPWEGFMDEVRLSSTVRYPGPAFAVPTTPFSPDSDTVALWHFNEAAGSTTFADASGNGNTLTAMNGAKTGLPNGLPALPQLAISRGTNAVRISWPQGNAGYRLETTPVLSPSAPWSIVTNTPAANQGQQTVTFDLPSAPAFFRLSLQ